MIKPELSELPDLSDLPGLVEPLVFSLPIYNTDEPLQNAEKQFNAYCNIRHDLRNADKICQYIIDLQKKLIDLKKVQCRSCRVKNRVRKSFAHAISCKCIYDACHYALRSMV